ncbi:hypothetical protein Mapa_010739 [Marchantia paleacea]|nr:hypothetical protein Mapa_010739 [Marchantia paleacea]
MNTSIDEKLQKLAEELSITGGNLLVEAMRLFNTCIDVRDDVGSHPSKRKEILSSALRVLGICREVDCLQFTDIDDADLLTLIEWDLFFTSLQLNPVLNSISIYCSGVLYSAICTHISILLASSRTLTVLAVRSPHHLSRDNDEIRIPLSETAIQALSEGLVQTKSLKRLELLRMDKELADVLQRVFQGSIVNESLENIRLHAAMGGLGDALPILLNSRNRSLKEIKLELYDGEQPQVDQLRSIGDSLCKLPKTKSETRLVLSYSYNCNAMKNTFGAEVRDTIDELVKASKGDAVLEIDLELSLLLFIPPHFQPDGEVSHDNPKAWVLTALNQYTQFTHLELHCDAVGILRVDHFLTIFEAIQANESLQSLTFSYARKDTEACWEKLFELLRHKRNLKKLSFYRCRNLDDKSFRSLMGLLQVNIYLQTIDLAGTPWEGQGQAVLLGEALKRNKAQAAYFSTLGIAKLRFHEAEAGRLFLCGHPLAGKTMLRMTMMRTRSRASWLEKQWNKLRDLKRTKGVDVELLKDDADMQISIWDLAGQDIFRALQHLILPKTSHASVFIFVFSPMKDNQNEVKDEVEIAFRDELRSWLRFVASSCQISGPSLPQVFVVITHRDKMDAPYDTSCHWAKDLIDDLREKFKDVLELHPGDELYYINAKSVKDVQPLTVNILESFAYLLQHKTPSVPWVCSKLISEVAKRPREMVTRPVWPIQDFYTFVSQRVQDWTARSFDPNVEVQREVLEAMSLYMHDVGSVFLIPDSNFIVVDVNWLTHRFLGQLISKGHNFQVKGGACYRSWDGFVAKRVVDNILFSLSTECGQKGVTVHTEILTELLTKLNLCYLRVMSDGIARYFMPTIFGTEEGPASQDAISWNTVNSRDWEHLGYRVLSEKRETTLLNSQVFPKFQIHLFNELKLMLPQMTHENFICARNIIRLDWNGCFIIVENDGLEGDHIDILVRYSKPKPRERVIEFVRDHVLEKFRSFCATSDGCPGVTLAVAIIRPECAKRPTPQKYREHQVVLVEDLKASLRTDVEKNLRNAAISLSQGEVDDNLLDYEHTWPMSSEGGLLRQSERAILLLEKKDLQEILNTVNESKAQRLQALRAVSEKIDELDSARPSAGRDQANACRSRDPSRPRGSPIPSHELQDSHKRLLDRILSHMDEEFLRVHDHLDEVHASLSKQLEGISLELEKIICLQRDERSTLLSVMSKLDGVLGYSDALQKAKVPRRPFLSTQDAGFRAKLNGIVEFGTPVRLHLMCESLMEPHMVQDQPGLRLLVEHENREWLRLISGCSLRVVWFLMKAGVQVLAGAGSALPAFSTLHLVSEGALAIGDILLDDVKNLDSIALEETGRMTQEAWLFLKDRLSDKINYAETFKLHLVKYNSGIAAADESHAWLCQNCIKEGLRNGVLQQV